MLQKIKDYFGGQQASSAMAFDAMRPRIRLTAPLSVIYVIPDVHGSFDALIDAERRIQDDATSSGGGEKLLVMLGDYVDRGPQSAEVIEHLLRQPPGIQRICLCGNHDDVMRQFMADPDPHADWLNFGGDATLLSYGVDIAEAFRRGRYRAVRDAALARVPPSHIDFLSTLPAMVTYGRMVFVHAGLRPGVPLDDQTDEDLMWIREPFLSEGAGSDQTVIHGHTVTPKPDVGPNRIGIDTGAYISGRLTVLRIARSGTAII